MACIAGGEPTEISQASDRECMHIRNTNISLHVTIPLYHTLTTWKTYVCTNITTQKRTWLLCNQTISEAILLAIMYL